jgi:hypothetical protein
MREFTIALFLTALLASACEKRSEVVGAVAVGSPCGMIAVAEISSAGEVVMYTAENQPTPEQVSVLEALPQEKVSVVSVACFPGVPSI